MFDAKQKISNQVQEFLDNGGVIKRVKAKKAPKGVSRTCRGLMGPSKRTGIKTA